jgi:hypothetical protein
MIVLTACVMLDKPSLVPEHCFHNALVKYNIFLLYLLSVLVLLCSKS